MLSLNITRQRGAKLFVFLFLSTLLSVTAVANTYAPNTFTDPVITTLNNATGAINGGATISLRSALMAADNLGGTHTVTLSTGTYNLSKAPKSQIVIGNTPQNITINGNGPANTIINMVNDANRDRILLINPVGTTNSPVISISGVTFQNGFLTTDFYGGGAIYSGGGTAESLTLTNCAFLNNTTPVGNGGGGAVKIDPRGNLTVDNCTFTNNVSNDADGAAILFIIYGTGLGTGYGTLSVTNSTFTGNSVNNPTSNADGGAISIRSQGGSTPFNATVNNNTFINNSADQFGGALMVVNSAAVSTIQIHFNRFAGNTSGTSAITSGLYMAGAGNVNAENNWWGCNTNPVNAVSTAPCNQASRDVGGGALDANPWLQLRTTAAPSPICNTSAGLGNTFTATTSFLNNSDGTAISVANLSRLIGLPVTWTSALGSLSSQQATIQAAGTATATFTSNGTGGTATVNAQVDNVPGSEASPARASVTVNTIPTAITSANATTFAVGSNGMFSMTASGGSPAPTFSKTGALPSAVTLSAAGLLSGTPAGGTGGTYPIVVTASNVCGSAPTQNFTLTVVGSISGTVTYPNASAPPQFISNVLMSGAGSPPVSTTTLLPGAGAGTYSLNGLVGAYTVTPTKTTGGVNGISSFDAAKIAQHAAGVPPFLNATQRIAADVSNNGVVSSFDAANIANYVVSASPAGITGTWRFFTPNPTFPVGASPTSRSYPSVNTNFTGDDYVGILVGEVSGNWNPSAAPIRPANGPERSAAVIAPSLVSAADNEILIPVSVEGAANKGIISYEFDLRYDPAVIQPQKDAVDLANTVSHGLSAVANAEEPGLLRVAVYGPMELDRNGVLLNLRFTAVGAAGSVARLTWERMMFNEGYPGTTVTDGQVELSSAAANQAEISGRLLTAMGQVVPNARVTLTGTSGKTRSVVSDGFGVYRFGWLQVGQTYTISVESRRHSFTPLTVSVTDQLVSVDVIAEP